MQIRTQAQQLAAAHASPQPFAANPLALLAVAFAMGVLSGLYLAAPLPYSISSAALSTLLALIALLRTKLNLALALVSLATFSAGATLASIERNNVSPYQLKRLLTEPGAVSGDRIIAIGEPVEITGVLERDPEVAPGRLYLFLGVKRLRYRGAEKEVSGEVVLLAPVATSAIQHEYDQLDLHYGARIRVMTTLERSDSFRNPGVSSFTEYLDRKGYDATAFVKSPLLIERLENQRVLLPLAWLYQWRRKLQEEIDAHFSTETAGVLDAAWLGNRYQLSRSTSERFRDGGTFHVLVISGLHITFLGGLVLLTVKRLTKNRVVQVLFPVVAVWSYSVAVGAETSVLRATLMFTVVLLAPLVSRHASSLNALGGVGIVLLVWRPSDLFDPSFQLTFVSVLAIVVLAWPLLQRFSAIGAWRPTRETPHPPSCARWVRGFCEGLYWSERRAERELARANYSYRLFKSPIASTLERLHVQRLLQYAFGAVVVSTAVQLVLLPLLIIYFHRLSLASFMLNIVVSVLMAAVAISAAVGLVIAQLSSTLAGPFINFADALNSLMIHSVDPFAKIGAASIRLPEYAGSAAIVYVLYYFPLTMLAFSLWRWKPLKLQPTQPKMVSIARRIVRLSALAQIIAIGLVVFHPSSVERPDGRLRVDFLDVGQGDSALVTLPDNTTLLIDGGGRPGPFKTAVQNIDGDGDEEFERDSRSIGESVVSEYLWWRGLDHVDYILATHADADHIDGLSDVARNFKVRAAIVARTPGRDPEYAKFSETTLARGIPVRTIGAGDEMRFGNVSISVLWPVSSISASSPSGNNDSLVLRLQFGSRSILLTGDIEMPAERAILKAVDDVKENLKADVVKVAHHGSKSSSTEGFVAATQPSFAIISVGQTSIFGHPNEAVVERWKRAGSRVLTTGKSGTITVTTDGMDLKVASFVAGGATSESP